MRLFRKTIHWLLFILSAVLIISGYGITRYQTVEKLTFGLLDKNLSFKLHLWLALPFIIIFLLHIYFVVIRRKKK